MAVDFVEADCEIGFGLVDLAEAGCEAGDRENAMRALEDADRIILDIEQRLNRLRQDRRVPFGPLLGELRREIEIARTHLPPAVA